MTEMNPLLALIFEHSNFIGLSEEVENEITPLDSQLNLRPGDHAIGATANTPLERDFTVVTLLDPSEHAGTFPDWEERLLKSYVFGEYCSFNDPNFHRGWFSRVKLLPITQEHFEIAEHWLPDNWPEWMTHTPPDWAVDYFDEYASELSKRAPSRVPNPVTCPNCNGRRVELHVAHRIEYRVRCGEVTKGDVTKIVPVNDLDERQTWSAQLYCTDCESVADLTDPEWILPGLTN